MTGMPASGRVGNGSPGENVLRALNLGCGSRFHPNWENVDFASESPCVRAYDLRKGIPYPDSSFDVVYHSHLLEHFPRQFAPSFLRECHRVLKPGGLIRVAVPDLEKIVRLYIEALEKATQGSAEWSDHYGWMMLEMYDQTVREDTCGECLEYFRRDPIPNWDFVYTRWGVQAKILLDKVREENRRSGNGSGRLPVAWRYALRNPWTVFRNKLTKAMLGREDWEALQLGRFRRCGEIHMWMYDTYSMTRLLEQTQFADIKRQTATESRISNWKEYYLDSEPDGTVYKPDSLYIEGVKT